MPRLSRIFRVFAIAGAVLAGAVLLRLQDPAFVAAVRDLAFDFYQKARPASREAQPVRVIDIDEASLSRFGQWPWPRTRLAELVDVLTELGAAAIAFDIVFAEPDRTAPARLVDLVPTAPEATRQALGVALAGLPDPDTAFAEALRRGPTAVGFAVTGTAGTAKPVRHAGIAFGGADPAHILPRITGITRSLPIFDEAAHGVGGLSLSAQDSTGIVRRVPMLFSDGEKTYPSLTTEALRLGVGASTLKIRSTGATGEQATGRPALVSVQIGREVVPLTAEGELWMRYEPDRRDLYVSVADLLDPGKRDQIRERIEGHIVLVGTSAAGLQDLRGTALGETVPGVSIHAQAIAQILARDFLRRPDWAAGLEVLVAVASGLLFVLPLGLVGARMSLLIGLAASAATLGGSWWLFIAEGLLVDPVFPLLAGLAAYLAAALTLYVTTDREKRFVRAAFGQYLAPDLVAELERSPDMLKLGGETREATILFMDVRGFTGLSEKLAPDEIVTFLNTLLSPLSDAIQAERGTIDKYIGDSIMAFWNAPLPVPDHPAAACRAALAMRAELERLESTGAFRTVHDHGGGAVRIGIGLNTGLACVGNMGSSRRFNYSAIGDAVNVAARIESASKAAGCDILVSAATAEAAPDFAFLPVGHMELKGKSADVPLFALIGDATVKAMPGFAELERLHADAMAALRAGDLALARDAIARAGSLAIPGSTSRLGFLARAVEAEALALAV